MFIQGVRCIVQGGLGIYFKLIINIPKYSAFMKNKVRRYDLSEGVTSLSRGLDHLSRGKNNRLRPGVARFVQGLKLLSRGQIK